VTGPARTPSVLAFLGSVLPVLLTALALCALGGKEAMDEAIVAVGAVGASCVLRWAWAGGEGVLWIVPAALVVGGVAALSGASLTSESLAAIAGLSLLFWIGAPATDRTMLVRSTSGLLLPGASVLLALLVTEVLPGGPARLGIASALLVLVLLAFGWAIRSDRTASADPAAGS
jgi:hypothetical protein